MTRRYSIVKPEVLWMGVLQAAPDDVFRMATYLLTGPSSELWGVWALDSKVAAVQTGYQVSKVRRLFDVLRDLKWAYWEGGWVFVPGLPASQFVRWPMASSDRYVQAAKVWYRELAPNPFLGRWWDFHLADLSLHQDPPVIRRGDDMLPVEEVPVFDLLGERIVVDPPLKTPQLDGWFDRIRPIYPKQDKMHRARVILAALHPTETLMQEIWDALQWQIQQPDWLKNGGRFAPSFANYLKEKRWLDKRSTLPRLNERTVEAFDAVQTFANTGEDECTKLPEKKPASGPRFQKWHS